MSLGLGLGLMGSQRGNTFTFTPDPNTYYSQYDDFTLNTLPATYTYTRNDAVQTYVDDAGILQTAAVNEVPFSHDPVTLDPMGILFEEDRTNLQLHSSDLTQWSPANTTATRNQVGLNGVANTASVMETTGTSNATFNMKRADFNAVSGTTYSVYRIVKKGTWDKVLLFSQGGTNFYANFNLTDGTIGSKHASVEAIIKPYLNDTWWIEIRYTATGNTTNSWGNGLMLVDETDTTGIFSSHSPYTLDSEGTPTTTRKNVIDYHAQTEPNKFGSSPIVTGASTASRVQAELQDTAINTRGYFNDSAGAVLGRFKPFSNDLTTQAELLHLATDYSETDLYKVYTLTDGRIHADSRYNDGTTKDNLPNISSLGQGSVAGKEFFAGFSWDSSEQNYYTGGSIDTEAVNNTKSGAMTKLLIGNKAGRSFNGYIQEVVYFDSKPTHYQFLRHGFKSRDRAYVEEGQSNKEGFYNETPSGNKNAGEISMANEMDTWFGTDKNNYPVNCARNGSPLLGDTIGDPNGFYWWDIVNDAKGILQLNAEAVKNAIIGAGATLLGQGWGQGEASSADSVSDHFAGLTAKFTADREIIGPNLPILMQPLGAETTPNPTDSVRVAKRLYVDSDSKAFFTAAPHQLPLADSVHHTSAGYQTLGIWNIRALAARNGITVTEPYRSPVIDGVSLSGDTFTIPVTLFEGSTIAPTTGIEGFYAEDSGGALTLTVTSNGTDTITAVSSTTPSGTVTFWHGYNAFPSVDQANTVADNEGMALQTAKYTGTTGALSVATS